MIEFALFYFILLALIIALIFVLLLYTGYHSRTLAPSLLGSNYGVIAVGTTFSTMQINDGEAADAAAAGSPTNEAINFANAPIDVDFIPLNDDRTRRLKGSMVLLMTTSDPGSSISLEMVDATSTDNICKESRFFIASIDHGLTTVRLYFDAPELPAGNSHVLRVRIKSEGVIAANTLQVNSIYVNYY